MWKKILLAFISVVIIVGAIAGVKTVQIMALIAAGENPPDFAESVTTVEVRRDVWANSITAVGSFTAVQGVLISNEPPGLVSGIHFQSGQEVEKGQLLVELETSTEQAQLQSAKASLELAKLQRDRSQELRAKNTVAQADLDTAQARFLEAEAAVKNLEAVIAKKRIVAPFAGRLGLREVNLGQFLNAGSPIVSLQSLSPIYVDFSLPQQRLGLLQTDMVVEARVDAYPGAVFRGKLTAITPEVDVATRSGRVRAAFANEDARLRPGMFGNVAVLLPEEKSVLVVPATSILYATYGDSVYIVADGENGGKIAQQKFVRILERRGDFVAIEAGLEEGDEVVATGGFKLRNGISITVNNDLLPDAKLNPTPDNA